MLRELLRSRDLIRMLAKKDFFANYRRASFGIMWAVALPVMQALVLSLIFSRIVPVKVGVRNFPTFVYSGVLPWGFFSGTMSAGVSSIVSGSALSTRIYFPRAVFPLMTVRSNFYGFAPGILVLVAMVFALRVPAGTNVLLLIPAVILLIALSAGFSLVLAALQVYYRDVRWLMSAILIPWFYASGIFFPLQLVPHRLLPVIQANPVVGVIQMFRAATVGADAGWQGALYATVAWVIGLLVIAAFLYRRYDRVFADRM